MNNTHRVFRGPRVSPRQLVAVAAIALAFTAMAPRAAEAACPAGYADVTGDGTINVVDTQCSILSNLWYLTGQAGPAPGCLKSPVAADLNCDGTTNVVDVTLTIQLALGQSFAPAVDADGNKCPDSCEANTCGNGTKDGTEECDDGNNVSNDGCSSTCIIEIISPTKAGDLVITEVMANPQAVADTVGEWFEVRNATAGTVNLNGVTIADLGTESHTISADVLIPSGGYAVLARSGDTAVNGGVVADYVYLNYSLANGDDEILLVFGTTVIDQVAYTPAWFIPNGSSLSLNPASTSAVANDLMENWCPASVAFGLGDKGTPGLANPNCGTCGDGIVEGLEQCDAGAGNSDTTPDACRTNCMLADCGDSVTDTGEACDDGNAIPADGCEADCTISPAGTCGNGVVEFGEQCDDGGTAPGDGCSATCTIEDQGIQPGDIIITEIMKDSGVVSDTFGEWVEVYNTTSSDLNLLGFVLRDNDFESHVIGQAVIVPAMGYALLGRDADPLTNGGVTLDYVFADFFLGNGDDEVVLELQGVVIDIVAYTDAAFPDVPGRSLSLDAAAYSATANDDGANWCAGFTAYGAGDFGTPGAANPSCPVCGDGVVEGGEECDAGAANSDTTPNACRTSCELAGCGDAVVDTGEQCDDGNQSNGDGCENNCTTTPAGPECGNSIVELGEQCDDGGTVSGDGCDEFCQLETPEVMPGELIITEIMQNPAVVADTVGEWFEIYNTTMVPLDLAGLVLKDNGTNLHVIASSVIVPSMGYAVLGNSGDLALNGGVTVDYVFPASYQLGNASDAIRIERGDGTLIDAVAYDDGATFPDPTGRSMSLDPAAYDAASNDSGANWCVSFVTYGAGDFGTPGMDNDPCPECGNGTVEGFEECDNGASNSDTAPNACRTDCVAASCQDGVVDSGEACDDGNAIAGDGCEPDCSVTVVANCGNGIIEGTEQCDDGAANSDILADACRTNCKLAGCGDGVVDTGEDCDDGNVISADGCSATCAFEAAVPTPGSLVITEIMQNPAAVADASGEWFEVYNTTAVALDLVGLFLKDNSTNSHQIATSVIVPPMDYVVLGNNGSSATNGGVTVDYVFPAASYTLGNATDAIRIELSNGTLIDQVTWDNGVTFPAANGASLNLDPDFTTAAANDNGANWCLSTTVFGAGDKGTPGADNTECTIAVCGNGVVEGNEECDNGAANSNTLPDACRTNCHLADCGDGVVDTGEECDDGNILSLDGCSSTCTEEAALGPQPGQIIITEVMQNPLAVGDSLGEWFEVFNATALDLQLQGLFLKDNGTNSHQIATSVIVPAMGYAVFANNGNTSTNGGVVVDYVFPTSYALGNGADSIRIQRPDNTLIDAVAWDDGATFPDPNGAAMNLDPTAFSASANDTGSNWCTATTPYGAGDLGTPGADNISCFSSSATYADVKPIFQSLCGGCHSGTSFCSGDTCFATSYSETQKPASNPICAGMNVDECILMRIQDGSMPLGGACTGDPILDAGKPFCATQADQDLIQSWLDGGSPEN